MLIRPARPEDAPQLVPLMQSAAPELMRWLYSPDRLADFLLQAYLGDWGFFGWSCQWAGCLAEQPIAVCTLYPGEQYLPLSLKASGFALGYYGFGGMLWRSLVLSRLYVPPSEDCLYLGNLAVQTELQRRGYGRGMLGHARSLGRQHGLSGIELDVAITNPRAQALYEAEGFAVTAEKRGGGTPIPGIRRMLHPL